MVVEPKQPKDDKDPSKDGAPMMISVILHVVVFALVIFGLPHWKHEVEMVDPVPVELVANVSELTQTNKPPVEAPKPDKEEPPKKEDKPKPEVKKEESAPPPPEEEKLKDPPKTDEPPPPDKEAEKLPDKKPPPKKEEKKPDKKPPVKKTDKKPDPKKDKKDDTSFDSLLNNLTPEEKKQPDTPDTAKKATNAAPTPNVSKFSDVLSMSELDALRQQLGQCWSVMAGAQGAGDLQVEVSVVVNQDRTVLSAKIVDQSRYGSDTFFRAAADSAMRALRNPLCTPLNLPPDKYDQWHEMTIVFDPKEMF